MFELLISLHSFLLPRWQCYALRWTLAKGWLKCSHRWVNVGRWIFCKPSEYSLFVLVLVIVIVISPSSHNLLSTCSQLLHCLFIYFNFSISDSYIFPLSAFSLVLNSLINFLQVLSCLSIVFATIVIIDHIKSCLSTVSVLPFSEVARNYFISYSARAPQK